MNTGKDSVQIATHNFLEVGRYSLKLSLGDVWVTALIVLLLVGTGLNKLLSFSSRKDLKTPFKNLKSYLPVLKRGWKLARENLWLFWIILGLKVLVPLQQTLSQYVHFKSESPDESLFLLFKSASSHPPSYLRYLAEKFVFSLKSFYFHFAVAWMIMPSILLCTSIVTMIWVFRKFLSRFFATEFEPSIKHLKSNFWPFVIANILLLVNYAFVLFFPTRFFQKELFFPRYCSILPGYYWSIVVNSLVAGFVLTLFKDGISAKETGKRKILKSSLKCFRPLFFFYLMYFLFSLLVYYAPMSVLWYSLLGRFPGERYLQHVTHVFPILFFIVPYCIVVENVDWKAGFRCGFLFWRRNFPQTLALLIVIAFITWLGNLLFFAVISLIFDLIPFKGICINMTQSIIGVGLRSLVTFFVTAVVMAFYLNFKEAELPDG